jgi:Zn-dependent M28 family amino/carboxypeptidase
MKRLAFPVLLASTCLLTNLAQAGTPKVEEPTLRAHLAFLASDLFEGRGTGQRGGELTMAYLETQARAMGLQAIDGKNMRQPVALAGVTMQPGTLQLLAKGQPLPLKLGEDWFFEHGDAKASHQFEHELVFGGYGTHAPEENWDDFKGVDCKGKILLLLANDPQPSASEPERFGGKGLTWYGRSSYKYEQARRQGAAGVLLIHTNSSVSAAWSILQNSNAGERFQLQDDGTGLPFQGWINEAAVGKLLAASGHDFAALRASAETREFRITPLGVKLQGASQARVRKLEQANIAALVPGTDPVLKDELVIYSAHWDHLGIQTTGERQIIYNGAVDNASGTASLLAMAKAAVQAPAKRSQLFLWVAAEEQGLLGSAAYAAKPLWPLHKTAANLNLDTMNFVGRTRDIGVFGSERSELGQLAAELAQESGLSIAPPRPDIGGVYFRSDHFSFAKVGIPAFSVSRGREFVNDPQGSTAKGSAYGQRYHQASDKYDPEWDLSGMVQQAQFTLDLGRKIANGKTMPAWKAGDPFGLVRAKTPGK